MFEKILVPLDGSPLAAKALPYAAWLAKGAAGQLLLVRAIETWAVTVHGAIEKELEQKPRVEAELEGAAAELRAQGLTVEQAVYMGEPASAIEVAASTRDVGLIAMSTHGRSGFARWAYGSVAERVLHHSRRPVLLVPAQCELTWRQGGNTILVPLDGSPLAEEALEPAKLLAGVLGAAITVLQVIEPPNMALAASGMGPGYYEAFDVQAWIDQARPYAEDIAKRLQDAGVEATAHTTGGYAAATIQEQARARNAAAIVMASHGRTGLARLALGSVAIGVVQRATAPVLVIRPVGVTAPQEQLTTASAHSA
jgi:nucleotide-binding universal stress UspA family protein